MKQSIFDEITANVNGSFWVQFDKLFCRINRITTKWANELTKSIFVLIFCTILINNTVFDAFVQNIFVVEWLKREHFVVECSKLSSYCSICLHNTHSVCVFFFFRSVRLSCLFPLWLWANGFQLHHSTRKNLCSSAWYYNEG